MLVIVASKVCIDGRKMKSKSLLKAEKNKLKLKLYHKKVILIEKSTAIKNIKYKYKNITYILKEWRGLCDAV